MKNPGLSGTTGDGAILSGNSTGVMPSITTVSAINSVMTYDRPNATAISFTDWTQTGQTIKMQLKDCIIESDSAGSVTTAEGHIRSNAVTGQKMNLTMSNNMFLSKASVSGSGDLYMWYDSGSTTGICEVQNTSTSISNEETVNAPTIDVLTAPNIPLVGNLKLSGNNAFNRS